MDRGCSYADEECQYSHSLELVAKAEAAKAATGGNTYPVGQGYGQNSFNDTNGSNNLINQRFRNVIPGANNNLSVELVEDLRHYPANDARRTLVRNRSGEDKRDSRLNLSSGNGRGTSGRGSHQEAPSRSLRPQSSHGGFKRSRSPSIRSRVQEENRDRHRDEDRGTRRPYERDHRDHWEYPRGRDQRARGQRRRY